MVGWTWGRGLSKRAIVFQKTASVSYLPQIGPGTSTKAARPERPQGLHGATRIYLEGLR